MLNPPGDTKNYVPNPDPVTQPTNRVDEKVEPDDNNVPPGDDPYVSVHPSESKQPPENPKPKAKKT